MTKPQNEQPEPWLRGTLEEIPAVPRAVLHALQLAEEDLRKRCASLSDEQVNARQRGLASVAFHLRHIAGSIDRLLSYAEERPLSAEQFEFLKGESDGDATTAEVFELLERAFKQAANRVQALGTRNLEDGRVVGKARLPSTLGGLLVHIAEHTQRHVGQAIVTARIVAGG